jgi:hypothetical protein
VQQHSRHPAGRQPDFGSFAAVQPRLTGGRAGVGELSSEEVPRSLWVGEEGTAENKISASMISPL